MLEAVFAMMGYLPAELIPKPKERRRSVQWPALRAVFIKLSPECAACGRRDHLQAHHVWPFHTWPELELDNTNLIVLCEPPGIGCHLLIGHLLNFTSYNPEVRADAAIWRRKIDRRPAANVEVLSLPKNSGGFFT